VTNLIPQNYVGPTVNPKTQSKQIQPLRPEDNPTGLESEECALERSLSDSVSFKVSQEKVSCTPSQQYILTPA